MCCARSACPTAVANSAIRIGLGRFNSAAEVDFAVDALAAAAARLSDGAGVRQRVGDPTWLVSNRHRRNEMRGEESRR